MNTNWKTVIALCFMTLVTAACQQAKPVDLSTLIDQTDLWVVTEIGGETTPGLRPASVKIDEQAGRISGTSGCNQFSANYQRENEALTISAISQTKKLCEPALNQQEQSLFALLASASSIISKNGQLIITGSQGSLSLTPSVADSQ